VGPGEQQPEARAAVISSMIFCNHRYSGPTGVVKEGAFVQLTLRAACRFVMSVTLQRCGATAFGKLADEQTKAFA